ncbi:MAG: ABC transporter permease [Candidatus Omnitrophica bacterium]|nr:ABC transporter permease [Candidatus Omnitrophota bacterium]
MRYELWMSWRYLWAQRRPRLVLMGSLIAMGGVALGVAALIIVLAVMSGFDHHLTEKLIGTNAHLMVEGAGGIHDLPGVMARIRQQPHVVGATPFVTGQAILRTPERALGVVIRGIDPQTEAEATQLARYVEQGRFAIGDREALLGRELSAAFGLRLGDRFSLIAPSDGKLHELTVGGIFYSGMYEYDASLVVVTVPMAQTLVHLEGQVSGIGVRVDALSRVATVALALERALPPGLWVRTWMSMNATLFSALKLEKTVMFLILALIVLVAATNITSTLTMMVTERTKDIGILKAIGATNRSIGALFTLEGLLIGLLGTSLGAAAGWGICRLLAVYPIIQLPSNVYYIDRLPVRVEWLDGASIVAAALAISLASTLYPAWQAARMQPVQALRYE